MLKKTIVAVLAVFVVWSALDFLIHGLILKSSYEATARLWRPMTEMKMGVMHLAVLIASFAFVCIYARLLAKRGVGTGLEYGLWFGLAAGVSMGYGTYSVMPIPYHMALTWFLGSLAQGAVGGVITGWIIRD